MAILVSERVCVCVVLCFLSLREAGKDGVTEKKRKEKKICRRSAKT